MKKTKLLSLVLTAALVLTTVFASTEAIFASSVTSGSQTYTEITAQDVNKIADGACFADFNGNNGGIIRTSRHKMCIRDRYYADT